MEPKREVALRSISSGIVFDDTCRISSLTKDHSLALSLNVGVATAPSIIDQSLPLLASACNSRPTANHSLRLWSSSESRASGVNCSVDEFSDDDSTKCEICEV